MIRQPVKSSNLESVGYENGILEVGFLSGSVYQYLNVPPQVHSALMSASSHGTYLAQYVKGVYSYRQIA